MRTCDVSQYSGLYYRIDFLQDGKKMHATAIAHENKIAVWISNWIQTGKCSDKYMLGTDVA